MLFFFYKGEPGPLRRFEALLRVHADWLGLRTSNETFVLPDSTIGAISWLLADNAPGPPSSCRSGRQVTFSAGPSLLPDGLSVESPFDPLLSSTDQPVTLGVDLESGAVTARVPLICPIHLYYAERDGNLIIATDIRPLMQWAGGTLDPVGVAALLRYDTIPAPYTLCKKITRVPCGYALRQSGPGGAVTVAPWVPPIAEWKRVVQPDAADDATLRNLDSVLRAVPERAAVFFSGGTDSGLFAARLSVMGRRDVQLINYAFSEDDPESLHAEKMARHLGLRFRRIIYDTRAIAPLVSRIGSDFSFPFGDLSTIPSHLMVLDSLDALIRGRAALLGVGADDLYEGGMKVHGWRRILATPRWLRSAIVAGLRPLHPWWRDDLLGKVWGISRRTLDARHEFGPLIAHNCLSGIGYERDDAIQREIEESWRQTMDLFSTGLGPEDRLALVHLMNGGMGWEAPKFDALRKFGVRAFYPFLDGPMLRHGFSLTWRQKCEGRSDKILLRRLLARSVPHEMARRPKRGFSPPFADMLTGDGIQEIFRSTLLEGDRPLAPFCDTATLKTILDRGYRGASLNRSAMNLLWVVCFTTSWLGQVRQALHLPTG